MPKIMFRPKWFDSSKDLAIGDLVYFQKEDGVLGKAWIIGRIEQVVKSGRDQKIRRVVIKYQNRDEDYPRFTDRTVLKLVKLFSIDEHQVQDDLGLLQKRIDDLNRETFPDVPVIGPPQGHDTDDLLDNGRDNAIAPPCYNPDTNSSIQDSPSRNSDVQDEVSSDGPAAGTRSRKKRCNCCCGSHCVLQVHTLGDSCVLDLDVLLPCSLDLLTDEESEVLEDGLEEEEEDSRTHALLSLNLMM